MRTTAAAPVLLALALAAGAAGCGNGPTDAGPAVASVSTTSTVPAFPSDTRPQDGGYGSGNGLGLTDVRTSQEDGFDRVVLELGGTGTPGWQVEYTTRPRADGSGEPVTLEGTAYLQVALRGLGMTYDTGVAPYGDMKTRVPGAGGVAEVAPGGFFEGDQLALIGLTGAERPFRVYTLADPTRVVVEVRTSQASALNGSRRTLA